MKDKWKFNFSPIRLKQRSKYLIHSVGKNVQEQTLVGENVYCSNCMNCPNCLAGNLGISISITIDIAIDPEVLLLEIYFTDALVHVGNRICQDYSWKQ